MDDRGILAGRTKERVALRLVSQGPYSAELTADQIGVIADVAEQYGSGHVRITPRQAVEVPHISQKDLPIVTALLARHKLVPGSTGSAVRNVTACSRWCLYNAWPVSDLARQLNNLLQGRSLPGKTDISLSGCAFSCMRSRTSDIGLIAQTEITITDKQCKHCSLCIKDPLGCQMDALTLTDGGVVLDRAKCVGCGFCSAICRPGTISATAKGFEILIGGSSGTVPREAVHYATAATEDEAIAVITRILERYAAIGKEGERLGDAIARAGMQVLEG